MRVRTCAVGSAFLLSAAAAIAAPQALPRVALDVLLDRAGWYLDYFVDEFENVVAEERYIQDSSTLLPSFSPVAGGRGAVSARTSPSEILQARHRELRSDFLLVKSPNTEALVPFRDVIDVDGVAVRDREARLTRLFLNAPSVSPTETIARAEQIREEGARYNLGSMRSTLGNPVLGLGVLQKTYQQRFHFTLGKEDRKAGPGVSVVEYREISSPAMIRGEGGNDLKAHGRLWIDTVTGRVLRTELQVEQPAVRAVVTTTFRFEERSGIAVPLEMRELYTLANGNRVHTVATYGRFRRFDVSANEEIHAPVPTIIEPWTGMTLVELPPGRFSMGSASSEIGRNSDEVLHDVEITRPFLLGKYEVTQQEWRTVMGASPSRFASCGPRCPVENITFDDVQQFLAKLNAHVATPGSTAPSLRFRLPTEAEWEYACRAHTTGPFSTGENLTTDQANYNGKYPYAPFASGPAGEFREKPTPVGTFPANPWGLADMHGNVWEWTADWYSAEYYGLGELRDPRGPASGSLRMVRGGSWVNQDVSMLRCAYRHKVPPDTYAYSVGFRIVCEP